jgi:hypothetical protein
MNGWGRRSRSEKELIINRHILSPINGLREEGTPPLRKSRHG